jgi:hypothetical protein
MDPPTDPRLLDRQVEYQELARPRDILSSALNRSPPFYRSNTLPPVNAAGNGGRPSKPNRPRKSSLSQSARKPKHERTKSKDNSQRRLSVDRKAMSAEPSSVLGPLGSLGKRWEDLVDAAASATEEGSRENTPVSVPESHLMSNHQAPRPFVFSPIQELVQRRAEIISDIVRAVGAGKITHPKKSKKLKRDLIICLQLSQRLNIKYYELDHAQAALASTLEKCSGYKNKIIHAHNAPQILDNLKEMDFIVLAAQESSSTLNILERKNLPPITDTTISCLSTLMCFPAIQADLKYRGAMQPLNHNGQVNGKTQRHVSFQHNHMELCHEDS